MRRTRRSLAAGGFLLTAFVCGALATAIPGDGADTLQTALEALLDGHNARAEALASRLTDRGDAPSPRAWLVVATARERLDQPADALAAYEAFLPSCQSDTERQYVQHRIDHCRQTLRPAPRPQAPSAWLTEEDRTLLAEVDDTFYTESSEHFIVRAKNRHLTKLIAREAERVLARICSDILPGQSYPHSVSITVWPDRQEYLANAQESPHWAGGGFSFSARDGVVTRRIDLTQRTDDGTFNPLTLDRVLPHEMCHLVLLEYFGDSPCPLFLDEGLAMMAEYGTDPQRVLLAGAALTQEAGIGLGQLVAMGPHSLTNPDVFYAEAYTFVSFLHTRLRREQFRAVLGYIKQGCTAAEAVQRALLIPQTEDFALRLAAEWEDATITDAQILRALQTAAHPREGEEPTLLAREQE